MHYLSSEIKCLWCSNLLKHLVNEAIHTANKERSDTCDSGEITEPGCFKAIKVSIDNCFISSKREDKLHRIITSVSVSYLQSHIYKITMKNMRSKYPILALPCVFRAFRQFLVLERPQQSNLSICDLSYIQIIKLSIAWKE